MSGWRDGIWGKWIDYERISALVNCLNVEVFCWNR